MYKNILVPVQFDEMRDTQASFLVARKLATDGAKFTVMHVMETIPSYAAAQIPGEVLENSRREAVRQLNQSAFALPGASAVLVSGHAGRTIVNYSDEHGIDCIVIASHKPGLENYLLGSTADRVVRHANCSVHVIR